MKYKKTLRYDFHEMAFFTKNKIHFNECLHPKLSIIIPVYNELKYTLNCLHSLMKECNAFEVEIIVINDKSTDDTKSYLEEVTGVRLVNNETNLGFLKNINKGLKLAKGEFVLLLNNDVVVFDNLLKELFYVFENNKNVGAVGAMAIHPSGMVLEAGCTIFSNGEAYNNGRFSTPENPHYNYVRKSDYCSGYCLLLKRLLPNNDLVQLDEAFLPAYYEETDLCMQLKYNHGLDVYYQPFAKLIHFESISYGQEKNSKKEKLISTNKVKFKNKWIAALKANHLEQSKSFKDFKDLRLKSDAILFLQDTMDDDVISKIESENNDGKKITVLLKSKLNISIEKIESLQRQGIEVLYPYYTRKGKYRSYFKIFRRILNGYTKIETSNVFFRSYFFLKNKLFSIST